MTRVGGRWPIAICLAVMPFLAMACNSRGEDDTYQHWSFQELSFDYPGSLEPGEVVFVPAIPAGNCICHVAGSVTASDWSVIATQSFRYDGDANVGVRVQIIDAGVGTALTENGAVNASILQQVSDSLGIQISADDQAAVTEPLAGKDLILFHSDMDEAQSGDGPELGQEHWTILDPATSRVYSVGCQFEKKRASGVKRACEAMLDSLTIAAT